MIDSLFGSKTRVKLLRLFYSNPNRSFYVREITRKIDEQINSVRRELSNLLSIGIISSDNSSNKLYYEVNHKYEYYKPLLEIFGLEPDQPAKASQQVGGDPLLKKLLAIGNVELALQTGKFTRDERSGIDLLLVGDFNQTKLDKFIEELEAVEGFEIRYTVMSIDDFKYRQKLNDRFVGVVLSTKHQVLVDKHNLITQKKEK